MINSFDFFVANAASIIRGIDEFDCIMMSNVNPSSKSISYFKLTEDGTKEIEKSEFDVVEKAARAGKSGQIIIADLNSNEEVFRVTMVAFRGSGMSTTYKLTLEGQEIRCSEIGSVLMK